MFSGISHQRINEVTDAIPDAYQLIAVTLTNGDVLLGSLGKHWRWNGESVDLAFNTEEGKQFGDSWICSIPLGKIADIENVSLSPESVPSFEMGESDFELMKKLLPDAKKKAPFFVQDYPNPLAAMICRHNMAVNTGHNFAMSMYVERAFSTDHVPPEGIGFHDDLILYADWDFFSRGSASPVKVGVSLGVTISKDFGLPLHREIVERLKSSWLSAVRDKTDLDSTKGTTWHGQIIVPSPIQDTQVEGETCIAVVCKVDESESQSVLLKTRLLKYPLEFLGYVRSVLAFHGELLPIPLTLAGKAYNTVMLARAIGYLKEIEEQHLLRRSQGW